MLKLAPSRDLGAIYALRVSIWKFYIKLSYLKRCSLKVFWGGEDKESLFALGDFGSLFLALLPGPDSLRVGLYLILSNNIGLAVGTW